MFPVQIISFFPEETLHLPLYVPTLISFESFFENSADLAPLLRLRSSRERACGKGPAILLSP